MSVVQAILIALAYAFARSSFNFGLGAYVFSQPLVAGAIVGLLLGDPARGAMLGGALNLISLGIAQLKFKFGPDLALIGYVGVPLMLLTGLSVDAPQTGTLISALLVLGTLLSFMRGLVNTVLAHWADFFAETGELGVVSGINILPSQVWVFISAFLPVLLLLRVDAAWLFELANGLPNWVQVSFGVTQKLLAALGIAISLSLVMRGSSLAYLLLGWLAGWGLGGGISPVQATVLGGSLAAIHAFLARKKQALRQPGLLDSLIDDSLPSEQEDDDIESPQALSITNLSSTFVLWAFFHNAAFNFERFQNMGVATALGPVGKRLWRSVDARASFLKRHLTLFNSEWAVGSYAIGAAAALEERKANGDAMNDNEFVGAKTSLMVSLDVLGNVLVGGVVTSLCVAVGAWLAQRNGLLGAFVFVGLQAVAVLGIALFSFALGYQQMRHWATWARANDWLRAGLFGAVRLGTFVLGYLLLTYAPIRFPSNAVVVLGEATIPLGMWMNSIAPGVWSLFIVLFFWWQLRYKQTNALVLLFVCVLVGVLGCWLVWQLGWLG